MTFDDYRDRYLAPLAGVTPPVPERMPSIAPSVWFRPARAELTVSLVDLYNAGVRSGHAESRAYLEARLDGYDRALEHAQGSWKDAVDRLHAVQTTLQAELDDARRVYDRNER